MIDWHTHILPGIDDGSRDVEQSLAMLAMLQEQGVHTVVATPHFRADDEPVDAFLERREAALETLDRRADAGIRIVPGAEVRYYEGISRMDGLKKLCVRGSELLLLEMPFTRWTEYTLRELTELSGVGGMTVVLAHIERYLKLQSRAVWDRLYDCGLQMQVNAGFFTGFTTRRKAISMLKEGGIQFLGSDCHNTSTRSPNIGAAVEIIRKKLGDDFVFQMNEYGQSMFA